MGENLYFDCERYSDALKEQMYDLLLLHWREVGHYQDIPLAPDWQHYKNADEAGLTRIFTARLWGKLVGYAVFFVRPNPHYKTSWQAAQDILFIHPDYRGNGGRFIQWCDQQLAAECVQAVYHHVKVAHNWGHLLERMGYELVDLVYARRLDRGRDSNDSQRGGDHRLDGVRHEPEAEDAQAAGGDPRRAGAAAVRRDATSEAAPTPGGAERRLDGGDDSDWAEGNKPLWWRCGGRVDERPSSANDRGREQQEDATGHLEEFSDLMAARTEGWNLGNRRI